MSRKLRSRIKEDKVVVLCNHFNQEYKVKELNDEPWIGLVCVLCETVLEDITVSAALEIPNPTVIGLKTDFVYDQSGNWKKYQSEEQCVCHEYKCFLVIPAPQHISGYVTVRACLYCDLQPQDEDTPDWNWRRTAA
jgi:hypothetical protein